MKNHYANTNNKGIGSFFPTVENDIDKFLAHITPFNPENKILFYTGRQAIKYVIELIKLEHKTFTIWLPEYYCMHVTEWIKSNYSNIKTYKTNPANPEFNIKAFEFASNNDVVLINNYWGISECLIDTGDKNIITLEDHSHGWLSTNCINSKADFCITSLRKSLPIPLGGMAWSPKKHDMIKSVKLVNPNSYEITWNKTLKAMGLKGDYEKTGNLTLKNNSLSLIKEAELELHENYELSLLNQEHSKTVNKFLSINYLEFKSNNLNELRANIKPNESFDSITSGTSTTFGLIMHIIDDVYFNKMRSHLICNHIYPSLLWPDNKSEYGKYLNIHLDFRYTKKDMLYIANTINDLA
jgi:hypothetical protein